jgi:hypothetical protein
VAGLQPNTYHPPLHFHLAESKYGNISGPATVLLPTNEAWMDFMTARGLNQTTIEKLFASPAVQVGQAALGLGITPLVSYHLLNFTGDASNFTSGRTLPTELQSGIPEAVNITVASTPINITFIGAANVNVTNGTAINASNATILANHTDVSFLGRPDILMDVVDKVLVPPEAVFNQTLQALAKADLETAAEQSGAAAPAPGAPTEVVAPAAALNATAPAAAPNATSEGGAPAVAPGGGAVNDTSSA